MSERCLQKISICWKKPLTKDFGSWYAKCPNSGKTAEYGGYLEGQGIAVIFILARGWGPPCQPPPPPLPSTLSQLKSKGFGTFCN